MKKFKTFLKVFVTSVCCSAIILIGCSSNTPVESPANDPAKRTTDQMKFLKPKNFTLAKVFDVSQLISAANGGTLAVGDSVTGTTSITFNAGDLSQDLTVTLNWDSQSFETEFGPHGSTFNNPVVMRLSYKDADLNGIDENDLRVWYYDENDDIWELAGQVVNTTEKYVEGTTTHFSRYAIGSE